MKKVISTTLLLAIISVLFTACSTKRYGRLENVTQKEAKYLSCQALEVEVEKVQNFIQKVNTQNSKWSKEDILAFLGDLGIGNRMEVSEALESAQNRLNDLKTIQGQKACN